MHFNEQDPKIKERATSIIGVVTIKDIEEDLFKDYIWLSVIIYQAIFIGV